jgi:hypothetical protein
VRAAGAPGGNSDALDDPSLFPLGETDKDGDEFTPEKERTEKGPTDPKKPKPDFSSLRLYLTPGDRREPLRFAKPGHWTAARIEARANNFDYKGELSVYPSERDGEPLDVEGTPFYIAINRPAVLAKGQIKQLDLLFYVPRSLTKPWLRSRLRDFGSVSDVRREAEELQPIAPYQHQLVVLAKQPERYAFLKRMSSLRLPGEISTAADESFLYRVIAPRVGSRAPLPREPLLWTSMAYLIWDDIGPQTCDLEQRQALIDWLHWGGHLIINGPQSLDGLRDSFLTPYLPATGAESCLLGNAELAELESRWRPPGVAAGDVNLAATGEWPAVKLRLEPGGVFIPGSGELVAERQVGRGRVICTSFSLTQPRLFKWRGFDGFLNACLLRRSPRFFGESPDGSTAVTWLDEGGDAYTTPRELTHLRYFVRDAGVKVGNPAGLISPAQRARYVQRLGSEPQPLEDAGVAAWNDFGAVAERARKALREGAGIAIPRRRFVLSVLACYLVVLAPLNWLVFRLLKRVELAWSAVPFISFGFAGLVIWLAQLDIGFARSSTELAIVEMYANYPRAHLTRFTALYSSLSTTYKLEFPESSALALPFASSSEYTLLSGESDQEVNFQTEPSPTLSGLTVASNSTSMVHSEALFSLPGNLEWVAEDGGGGQLVNHTGLNFHGVRLVRRAIDAEGSSHYQMAWVGDLAEGASSHPTLTSLEELAPSFPQWQGQRPPESSGADQSLNLTELVQLAEHVEELDPGELRLVGWCDEALPSVTIEPVGARRRYSTLVVGHLAFRASPPPRSDVWKKPPREEGNGG